MQKPTSQWIKDPSPVWSEIKSYMTDDSGELATEGTFVGTYVDGELAGAFMVVPWTNYCFQLHGGVIKKHWGKGKDICLSLGVFLFNNTPALKLVAAIPDFNHLMRKCVQAAGLKQEGIITKAFLKRMKLHNLYIYGIGRESLKWHQ